jgi:hypothetical protein
MEIKNIGKYLHKIRLKWEDNVSKTQPLLEDVWVGNEKLRKTTGG